MTFSLIMLVSLKLKPCVGPLALFSVTDFTGAPVLLVMRDNLR